MNVVVVGTGVVGAAVGYYLAEAGDRVVLVDRGDVGSGTSSRCEGDVLAVDKEPGYDADLTLASLRLLRELAERVGGFEYRQPGSYLVLGGDDEVELAEAWVNRHRAAGLALAFLDAAAVRRELPDIGPDVPAAIYCPPDASINPLLYVRQLLAAARDRGARVLTRAPVQAITTRDGRVSGVRLGDGTRLEADAVVLAAGVWTPALVRELGVRLPIRPRKGHLVVAARGHRFGSVKVMEFGYLATKFGRQRAADPEAERYGVALVYEPTMSGNFLLGSSREFVGFDTTPDMAVARAIVRRALRFYPTMRNASALRVYAGLRPWTPDHRPVIGPVDAVPGLVVAAGHEGDGVGLSAVTGALVRDVLHERGPLVDLDPLRWDRFAGVGWEEAEDEPAGT